MFKHARLVAAVGGLAILPTLASLQVDAEASDSFHRVRVEASTTNPVPATEVIGCDAANQHCLLSYHVSSQVTGTMHGTMVSSGEIYAELATGTYQSSLMSLFTGVVDGCGSGTLVLSWPLAEGGTTPFSGRVVVVDDSGTAGLTDVSGAGTFLITPGATVNTAVIQLRLQCRPT
jgi:hypothetical protein